MIPSSSGPTPLNPRGGEGRPDRGTEPPSEGAPTPPQQRSESSISTEAQAVRTLASAHRLAGEIENGARRRADEINAQAELAAAEREREARARAEALIAEATAERDRIWEQIRVGVGRATRQVGELLQIREELRADLREAMRESTAALNRLEEGGGESVRAPAAPPWLPSAPAGLPPAPRPPAGPPPAASIPGRASEVSLRGSPLSPRPPVGAAGSPAPPATGAAGSPAPPTTAASQPTPARGESLSSLRAGPFESFLAVMRFERELAALPAIDAVYVRRFSNGEVDVEVESPAGSKLAESIRGLPSVTAVQAEDGLLRLRVRAEAPDQE